MEDAGIKPEAKDSAILAALPYVLGWLVALLIYLIAKEDRYARYHALQSLLFGLALTLVLTVVGTVGFILYLPVFFLTFGLANFVLMPVMMLVMLCLFLSGFYFAYLAYQGRAFMLPYVGKMTLEHV